jgi:PEP-CTERM motif
MANSICQKLAFTTAAAALSLAGLEAYPAQAAIITYDFTVDITSGPLLGNQYNGFFSYDDASPSGAGNLLIPYFDVTEFNFDFPQRTNTPSQLFIDGRVFPFSFPLRFTGGTIVTDPSGRIVLIPRGGELQSFGFSTFNPFRPPFPGFFTLIGSPSSLSFFYQLLFNPGEPFSGTGSGTVSLRTTPPTAVPEPSTIVGLSMLGLGWLLRKKKAFSHT